MTWSSVDWTATEAVVGRIQDRIFRAAKIKRPRLEPDDEQSSCPVLRGLGSGNGARLPDFVYGRRKQEVSPGDPPLVAERRRPMEEWDIVVPDTYPAYIGYDQYLVNRRHLRDNLYNFAAKGRGAPREGRALLQGLVVCGRCGRRMSVSHGSHHLRYQCRRAQADYAAPLGQAFPAIHLDRALADLFLEAVKPAAIETTLAALAVLERERRALDRHWQLRIERARYEAQRAQRQYDAIEPENRLVARTLEARWNAALEALEQLEQEYASRAPDRAAAAG